MLKTPLLHPEILGALGAAGHGARVLIADGNYPFSTEAPVNARRVFLNVRPGLVSVPDVLQALAATIPIEAAMLMEPADSQRVDVHETLRTMLPPAAKLVLHKRLEFYAEAKSPSTALVIATGEERRFANVLLTIGVVSKSAV